MLSVKVTSLVVVAAGSLFFVACAPGEGGGAGGSGGGQGGGAAGQVTGAGGRSDANNHCKMVVAIRRDIGF